MNNAPVEEKHNIQDQSKNELIQVVMRQTNYDEEKCIEKLKHFNYNVNETILDYMKPSKSSTSNNSNGKSGNQMMYSEFRKFLDEASLNYERGKHKKEN